ncbi:DinB family protein [Persicitalea jodogahamensis]|uniref:DinB-like domain-containing protein n=1 Tax=Persicitalea jodogahamensis TaxID=402147 RepID=A0A8J3G7W6_9BACT|nr:DinB family protein [Persicitalea jodogahamensis]GHB53905.1 hypothetical protein GCM10007390_03530 [Persicitalea jodogahamensis]
MKYFLLLLILGSSFAAFAQSEAVHLQELQQKWTNAKAYTLALAESMPAEKYSFRPVEGEMTFGTQMVHLSSNMVWLCSEYLTDKKPPRIRKDVDGFADKSKDEVLQVVSESLDYASETLKNFDPEKLNETVRFFSGPMTKRQIINLMNDHLTHHRAQAIVYLRLNGVLPPKYVGW